MFGWIHRRKAGREAETFRDRLVETRIAHADEIEGCSEAEIAWLESLYGPLPETYKAWLAIAGRRAGALADNCEVWIYFDRIEEMNALARSVYLESGEAIAGLPGNAVFIGSRLGGEPYFLVPGAMFDSPVWQIDEDGKQVRRRHESVWDWLEGYVEGVLSLRAFLAGPRKG